MSTSQITLYSGLPGNGKTAFVVAYLDKHIEQWKQQGRRLFVHGINDLTIEHERLDDPHKWYELPGGSIIVIDEAQEWFRPRHASAAVPDYITALERIRHSGHEMIIITQHPGLIDGNFKRLVGSHYHVERIFGGNSVTLFRWPRVVDPQQKTERRNADKSTQPLPSQIFSKYKSAEIHTIKRQIPKSLKYLIGILIFMVCAVSFAIWYIRKPPSHVQPVAETEASVPVQMAQASNDVGHSQTERKKTALEWYQERTPRLNGMPHTAPVYDGITAPTVAPKPVACVSTPKRCHCYSQQGTRMPTVDDTMCREIAQNGYFDDSPARSEQTLTSVQRQQPAQQSQPAAAVTIPDGTGESKKWPVGNPAFTPANPYRS